MAREHGLSQARSPAKRLRALGVQPGVDLPVLGMPSRATVMAPL